MVTILPPCGMASILLVRSHFPGILLHPEHWLRTDLDRPGQRPRQPSSPSGTVPTAALCPTLTSACSRPQILLDSSDVVVKRSFRVQEFLLRPSCLF